MGQIKEYIILLITAKEVEFVLIWFDIWLKKDKFARILLLLIRRIHHERDDKREDNQGYIPTIKRPFCPLLILILLHRFVCSIPLINDSVEKDI